LRQLADTLERERKKHRKLPQKEKGISFVREGQAGSTGAQKSGVLTCEMRVDLEKRLVFPEFVQTTLRPDIVLLAPQGKKIVLIELTVPWEERCDEAYERKSAKYTQLTEDCRKKGWKAGASQLSHCGRC
jgi:hypothetical protein